MARTKIKRKGLDWKGLLGEEKEFFKKSCKKCSKQKWMKRSGREKENGAVNGMDTAAAITSGG